MRGEGRTGWGGAGRAGGRSRRALERGRVEGEAGGRGAPGWVRDAYLGQDRGERRRSVGKWDRVGGQRGMLGREGEASRAGRGRGARVRAEGEKSRAGFPRGLGKGCPRAGRDATATPSDRYPLKITA